MRLSIDAPIELSRWANAATRCDRDEDHRRDGEDRAGPALDDREGAVEQVRQGHRTQRDREPRRGAAAGLRTLAGRLAGLGRVVAAGAGRPGVGPGPPAGPAPHCRVPPSPVVPRTSSLPSRPPRGRAPIVTRPVRCPGASSRRGPRVFAGRLAGWTASSASTYGDGFAEVYDRWYPDVTDTDRLRRAAGRAAPGPPGRVLELGIGTGRLALPLAERGLAVTGLDASADDAGSPGRASRAADAVARSSLGDMADLDAVLAGRRRPAVRAGLRRLQHPLQPAQRRRPSARCVRRSPRASRPAGGSWSRRFVPRRRSDGDRRDDVAVSRIDAHELVLSATLHDRDAADDHGPARADHRGRHPAAARGSCATSGPAQLDELAADAGLEPRAPLGRLGAGPLR